MTDDKKLSRHNMIRRSFLAGAAAAAAAVPAFAQQGPDAPYNPTPNRRLGQPQEGPDTPKLTTHLKSPDFFGVKSNPKAKFVSTKVEKSGDDYKVTGDLTLLGKSKSISFPAKLAVENGEFSIASSFTIDRTQWGMTYGQGKIDDEVKLTVSVKAK